MFCRYERAEFPDDQFRSTVLGFVHEGTPVLHLTNGESITIADLEPPLTLRPKQSFDKAGGGDE